MRKYKTEFKLEVVQSFLAGNPSQSSVTSTKPFRTLPATLQKSFASKAAPPTQ